MEKLSSTVSHTQKTFIVKLLGFCLFLLLLMFLTCPRARVPTFYCNSSHCHLFLWLFTCYCYPVSQSSVNKLILSFSSSEQTSLSLSVYILVLQCFLFSAQRFISTSRLVTIRCLRLSDSKQLSHYYNSLFYIKVDLPPQQTLNMTERQMWHESGCIVQNHSSHEEVLGLSPNFNQQVIGPQCNLRVKSLKSFNAHNYLLQQNVIGDVSQC